jgi:hypothetical protein
MALGPQWLQRFNFIERAKLERELWDAFERGEAIEQLVEQCQPSFRKEVWTTTAQRIRKIEQMMKDQQAPKG